MAHTKLITVSVNDAGQAECSPNPAKIRGNHVLLTYQLLTPGYAFPDSEAVVVTDGASQFPFPSWTQTAAQAALLDSNTALGTFAYTVTVVEVATGKSLRVDPTIENQTK